MNIAWVFHIRPENFPSKSGPISGELRTKWLVCDNKIDQSIIQSRRPLLKSPCYTVRKQIYRLVYGWKIAANMKYWYFSQWQRQYRSHRTKIWRAMCNVDDNKLSNYREFMCCWCLWCTENNGVSMLNANWLVECAQDSVVRWHDCRFVIERPPNSNLQ